MQDHSRENVHVVCLPANEIERQEGRDLMLLKVKPGKSICCIYQIISWMDGKKWNHVLNRMYTDNVHFAPVIAVESLRQALPELETNSTAPPIHRWGGAQMK